jgi:hypothetical protein
MSNKLHLYIDLEPMGVPYRKPNTQASHAYIDLKAEPGKVSLLPELKNWPELADLIRSVNETDYYKTVGSGAWLDKRGGIVRFHSYLQFCFDERAVNEDAMHYYYVFHQFARHFDTKATPDDLRLSFVVTRTDFNGEPQPLIGWSAQVIINGEGRTSFDARFVPNKGYRLLVDFLASHKYE